MKVMNFPFPIVLAGLIPQMDVPDTAPTWFLASVTTVFVIGWFMAQMGKLPGVSPERRSPQEFTFTKDDREILLATIRKIDSVHEGITKVDGIDEKVGRIHGLLAHRSSEDGFERFLEHHRMTRDTHSLVTELLQSHETLEGIAEDHRRSSKGVLETLQTIERSLRSLHQGQREIIDRMGGRAG